MPLRRETISAGFGCRTVLSCSKVYRSIMTCGDMRRPIHIAFEADTRTQVQEFYNAAIAAGGKDNGTPSIRGNYSPNYYAAFVIYPDGHNIEAECRTQTVL